MRTVLIGEARGRKEAKFKHGFVGTSGQELIRMIGEAGLAPKLTVPCRSCNNSVVFGRCQCGAFNPISEMDAIQYWTKIRSDPGIAITNVFHERPSDESDDVKLFFGSKSDDICHDLPPYSIGSRKIYLLKKNRHYLDQLHAELEELKPNLIVLLGNTACWAVIQQTKISALRGTVQISPFGRCLPTYHPAALRDWSLRPVIIADLKKAATESEINFVYRKPRWLTVNPTLDEIAQWARKPKKYLVCDIESGWALYTKKELNRMAPQMKRNLASQISIVGFARSPTDGLVIPFMTRESHDLSYWNSNEEPEAWAWVQKLLSSPVPKIFQNGMYDISRLIHFGIRPTMCYEDTMLLQHSFYPEMLKSLGFLGSIHSREIDWKNMRSFGESLKRDD